MVDSFSFNAEFFFPLSFPFLFVESFQLYESESHWFKLRCPFFFLKKKEKEIRKFYF